MVLHKSLAVILSMGLALAGAPLIALDYAPNTIWGEAPGSVRASSAFAVLQDTAGNLVGTVPVTGGTFSFESVPPGDYTVALQDAARFEIARSLVATMSTGGVTRAIFASDKVAGYVPPSTSGGIGTTGWILIGAGAVGITTAIILLTNNDEGNASPSE